MSEIAYEKLQQLIFDENKIVSFKLLTKLLKIHVNIAKKYLQDYFDSNKNKLNAYYVVIGQQKNEQEKVTKVSIVPSVKLEEICKSFITVTSCHIYCIHKGELADKLALFSNCDKLSVSELNNFSAVKNSKVSIQSPQENAASVVPKIEKAAVSEKQIKIKKEVENESIPNSKNITLNNESKPAKKEESKASVKNKGANIFSMFQKQVDKKTTEEKSNQKKESPVSNSKKPEENHSPKKEEIKNGKDIKQLFSKQVEKGNNVSKDKNSPSNSVSNNINQTCHNTNHKRKNSRIKNQQNKKTESDSDEEMKSKKKKHRRIVQMEDTDSESENEEFLDKAQRELANSEPNDIKMETNEDEANDPEDCIPPTQLASGKIKKWKNVTKTFQDDDGFFITKRTKEYVTDSEGSEAEDSKKAKPIEKPKEVVNKAAFANKKQASLTSFFKQK